MARILGAAVLGGVVGLIYPNFIGAGDIPMGARWLFALKYAGVAALLALFLHRYGEVRRKALERLEEDR